MGLFRRGDPRPVGEPATPQAADAALFAHGFVPYWFRRLGTASWYTIGIVIVLAGLVYALHALATLVVPALFAVLLGATFMPAVDWLERHHVGRAWGAFLMTMLIVVGAFALLALMTVGIIRQWPTIETQVESAVGWIDDALSDLNIDPDIIHTAKESLTGSMGSWARGIFGGALQGITSLATMAFGVFIGLNILVYVLIGGRRIAQWSSHHMGPVPPVVGYSILAKSARFLRGYIWGSTLIGIFNGAVVGSGALVLGVPLVFTIFVVQWFTNYIPMFGAFIGGAFAVLVALGTGGVTDAVWMLVFVLIANGPLQTVVAQFALGASLKLSGLVVLFATTGGAILAGALGGIFAAPFVKIGVDAYQQLKAAGLFEDRAPEGGPGEDGRGPGGPPGAAEAPPPGAAAAAPSGTTRAATEAPAGAAGTTEAPAGAAGDEATRPDDKPSGPPPAGGLSGSAP
ncbi:MAG: AI-2E family transporter [Actinobacteria bacterium]|nr:AI-2E family transporter [Actinomycetota bacterium]